MDLAHGKGHNMGVYSNKLWAAAEIVEDYNSLIEAEGLGKSVDVMGFIGKLQNAGGLADELLRQCTWEDLENCGLPRLLARKVSKVFRASDVCPPDPKDKARLNEKYEIKKSRVKMWPNQS
jgi:hypothetical protein